MMLSRAFPKSAFTLLEVLLATTLLMSLSTALISYTRQQNKDAEFIKTQSQHNQGLIELLTVLRDDLSLADQSQQVIAHSDKLSFFTAHLVPGDTNNLHQITYFINNGNIYRQESRLESRFCAHIEHAAFSKTENALFLSIKKDGDASAPASQFLIGTMP